MNHLSGSNEPVLIVIFASEQVWPNLVYLEWAAKQRADHLLHLLIVHSKDTRKSLAPAKRFKKHFAQKDRFTSTQLLQFPDEPGKFPRIIQAAADKLNCQRVFINGTGGLKLWTIASTDLIRPETRVDYHYCEIDGSWLNISRSTDQQLCIEPIEEIGNTQVELTIEELIFFQSGHQFKGKEQPLFNLSAALQQCVNARWNWETIYRWFKNNHPTILGPLDVSGPAQAGTIFELLFAGIIKEVHSGNVQLLLNAKQELRKLNAAGGTAVEENDILMMVNNRLTLFDLKVGKPGSSFATQIHDARNRAERLGGRTAQAVLVRPGFQVAPENLDFSRMLNVKVLHGDKDVPFLTQLNDVLGEDQVRTVPWLVELDRRGLNQSIKNILSGITGYTLKAAKPSKKPALTEISRLMDGV